MEKCLRDTSSKPLAMQQKVNKLLPHDHTEQLQRLLDRVPKAKMTELGEKAKTFIGSLSVVVSSVVDLLEKAPVLPQGLTLNPSTGELVAKLVFPVANCPFTIRAYNDTGESVCKVVLSAKGQIPPRGLTYAASMPTASEFAKPPQSTGLILVGDTVSMKPAYDDAGTPAGTFSIQPFLPSGLSLHAQTGVVSGTPASATARKNYTVSCANQSGKSEFIINLEVQKHSPPGVLEYPSELGVSGKLYKILTVDDSVAIIPTQADQQNHLIFSASPALPAGLELDATTGAMAGSPSITTGKVVYTITARNRRGQTTAKIAFGVAGDWQITQPKEWSVEMCQMWFKDELKLAEDDRSHLLKLNGSQLMLLQSPQAVASQYPAVQPVSQVFIARSVVDVLRKWDAPEQQVAVQRPVGVKEGDDAQLAYFSRELSREYVPLKVLGVGSFGVVVSADVVKKGHRKYTVAIKLVYSGGGPSGFPEKAARRLDREATLLARVNSPYIVQLRSYGFSAANDVFWLIMEHLEGSSLDTIMRDPGMRFKEEHVVGLALQVLTGLAELHELLVIHRDIKPANIVLGPNGPKIIDLGAAAVLDVHEEEVNQSLVTQGTVLNIAGTHGFMPPEAYRDREQLGRHSDIFALAATLYFLLSSQMPFQAKDQFGWMFAVAGNMEEQAPRLTEVCSGISTGLSDIIAQGLQKKIPERYTDALHMKRDLEEHIKSKCSTSIPGSWKAMSAPWQDVELVELEAGAPESKEVSDLFHATCSEAEWRITKIERVQNLPQMHLYETHKRTIEARKRPRGANDKRCVTFRALTWMS